MRPCVRGAHSSAAEDAAGAITYTVAGSVADGCLRSLDDHFDHTARATVVLPVTPGIRAELVLPKEQREAPFGDFEAAEFDAAGGLPFAAARPAIAVRAKLRRPDVPERDAR